MTINHLIAFCITSESRIVFNMVFSLTADARLAEGGATGALLYFAADGVRKLQVRAANRGRGLFAASCFSAGDTITNVAGHLADACNLHSSVKRESEVFQVITPKSIARRHNSNLTLN